MTDRPGHVSVFGESGRSIFVSGCLYIEKKKIIAAGTEGDIMKRLQESDISMDRPWEWEPDPEATGRQLRRMRKEHGMSQEALSAVISAHCTRSACKNVISKWETGKLLPSLTHVAFLAGLYGCSIDELVMTYGRESADGSDQPVLISVLLFYRFITRLHPAFLSCRG